MYESEIPLGPFPEIQEEIILKFHLVVWWLEDVSFAFPESIMNLLVFISAHIRCGWLLVGTPFPSITFDLCVRL